MRGNPSPGGEATWPYCRVMTIASGAEVPPLARSGAAGWTARRYADVRAVLADARFKVAAAGGGRHRVVAASLGGRGGGPARLDVVVAQITLLVQACDATAGPIGAALHRLPDSPAEHAAWPTEALLAEVPRHSPPMRASRRVAGSAVDFDGCQVVAALPARADGSGRRPPRPPGKVSWRQIPGVRHTHRCERRSAEKCHA
jgi:hypothetical protein